MKKRIIIIGLFTAFCLLITSFAAVSSAKDRKVNSVSREENSEEYSPAQSDDIDEYPLMTADDENEYPLLQAENFENPADQLTADTADFHITQYATDIFTDVSCSQWFAEYVQKVFTLGMMKGMSPSEFAPNTSMSRAMFVQVLYNMEGNPALTSQEMPFRDVRSGSWYFNAVCWAYQNHIVSGMSDEEFAPEASITREQAVKILYYYTGIMEETDEDLTEFADYEQVSGWAYESMVWAADNSILGGSLEDGILYLRPRNPLKRSEAAKILSGYYTYRTHESITVTLPEETHISASQIKQGVRIPSLMYHEISDDIFGLEYMFVSPSAMREQLEWLKDNGYDTIFFSDLTHLQDYDKPIILTCDDGYIGNYDNLFPLLKEFNMKATVFVVTDTIGQQNFMTASQIKEMSDSGLISIQSHTKNHAKLDGLNESELLEQYQQSKTVISSITGKSPYVLSYPEGLYSSLSKQTAAGYFSFGVEDRNGPWKTGSDLFSVKRTGISRDMNIDDFKWLVKH